MPTYILFLYAVSILFMLLIGILVLEKDYKSPIHLSFFLFTLCMIGWMISLYSGYYFGVAQMDKALFSFRMTWAASVILVYSLSLFVYYFPEKVGTFEKWIALPYAALTFVFFGIAGFTPLLEKSLYLKGGVLMDSFGPFYPFYLTYIFLSVGYVVATFIRKIIKIQGMEKEKVIYVASGFLTFVFLVIISNIVLPAFGIFTLEPFSVTCTLTFFLSVFYAIYKKRFFNFSYVTLNITRKITIIVAFLVALALFHMIASHLHFSEMMLYGFGATFGLLVYTQLEKYFPPFYSSSFRYLKNVLIEFETNVYNTKVYDHFLDLFQHVFVEKLNFSNVKIFLLEKKRSNRHFPTYVEDRFTSELSKVRDVLVYEELPSKSPTPGTKIVLEKMRKWKAFLCFPLYSEGKMIGFFTLGNKPKKSAYGQEEIYEILKVKRSIEICFMNIFITNTLREENDIMKKIIAEKTETLKRYNKELQKMIDQQDNFISLMAHEFKTPLTAMILGLDHILTVRQKDLPGDVADDLQTTQKQLNKLTILINRLLEIRWVEDKNIEVNLEDLELIGFLREEIDSMRKIAATRGIHIKFMLDSEITWPMLTDRVKLQQVLSNLLQNAVKFSQHGGGVKVTLEIDKAKKMASISIQDKGKGIPKKDLPIIFHKFQQGSSKGGGIGIGLYLCREYVRLLRGHIDVESTPGKGSTFTITLPKNF